MEEIIKIDPLTGKEFVAKRSNQRFATLENKNRYHNKKNAEINKERAFFDKPCKKSELVLRTCYNPKSNNIFHEKWLEGKGVSFDAYNHVEIVNNEKVYAYYGYAIQKLTDPDFVKIIKL